MKPGFGEHEPYSADDLEVVLFRLFSAIEALHSEAPPAANFVTKLAKTVVPRSDRQNPTFKGSSNISHIGRINIINGHLSEVNYSVFANSLVHESIHNYLYLHEDDASFFSDDSAAQQIVVVSPWSEQRIHLRAFMHAIYVWYGLFWFWQRFGKSHYFSPQVRNYYLGRSQRGFVSQRALSILTANREHILSKYIDAFSDMRHDINSELGLQC